MNSRFLLFALLFLVASCTTTQKAVESTPKNGDIFSFSEMAKDKTYGYTQENPIKVGGIDDNAGPRNEQKFLESLTGPNGERISYQRTGSCCSFKTDKGFMGAGLLDKYEVRWKGQDKPVLLYINMYDYEALKVPVGFKKKK